MKISFELGAEFLVEAFAPGAPVAQATGLAGGIVRVGGS